MTRIIITLFAAMSITAAVAQTNPAAVPNTMDNPNTTQISTPNTITSRFNADYPNNNPTWTMDGQNYKAEYTDRSTNMGHHVTYDKNGSVIGREEQVAASKYPTAIGDYYTQNYPGERYDVWSSEDKNGNKTYYTTRNNETYWFDTNGKYTKKTKMNTGSKKTSK